MAEGEISFSTIAPWFVAAGIVLVGPATAQPVRVTDDWLTLRPHEGGFRVLMPPDWEQSASRTLNGKVGFRAQQPAPSGRPGVTNCTVVVTPTPETAAYTQPTLDAEVSAAPAPQEVVRGIASTLSGSSIRENRVVRVGNQWAYFMVYSGVYQTMDITVYTVAGGIILYRPGWTYGLTCSATDRTAQQAEVAWNAWQPTLIAIFGTFSIEDR